MLAFSDNNDNSMGGLQYLDTIINLLFFMDIVIIFFTAYYDADYMIID